MMLILALFLIDLFAFRLTFRRLSDPDPGYPQWVRLGVGVLVVFFMTLVTLWVVCSPWAMLAGVTIRKPQAAVAIRRNAVPLHGEPICYHLSCLYQRGTPYYMQAEVRTQPIVNEAFILQPERKLWPPTTRAVGNHQPGW